MRLVALTAVFALLALPAVGQVYRCKDATGRQIFSDRPCEAHQTGGMVQRKRTDAEIYREREQAFNAEAAKQQRYMAEQQREWMEQSQQSIQAPAVRHSGNDWAARQRLKDLETSASSITNNGGKWDSAAEAERARLRDEEARRRAAQAKTIPPTSFTNCNAGFCYDNQGSTYHRVSPDFMTGPNGQACHRSGNFWNCN
ncbi:DUF4124 domain-containing protein [Comamonas sp. w2-DMI]|uniref:DUF4124 domain-containing protein n=1 Tax=Comamonas sp. w2-DMI TaxID=3126391 RepID=UPI0032E4A560